MLKAFLFPFVVAYLVGSIPWAVWIGKLCSGKDVRDFGSGNAGATNVYRMCGLWPALTVFLLDGAKGVLAVWLFRKYNVPDPWILAVAFFVILGHIFPVLAGFSGGKGISTAAGVLFLVDPLALVIAICLFGFTLWYFRLASVASLLAAGAAFLTALFQMMFLGAQWEAPGITALFLAMSLVTHRSNFRRLKSGGEPRLF